MTAAHEPASAGGATAEPATSEPRLLAGLPPALRRDRMLRTWIAVATLSWLGDAAFTVALSWTAVRAYTPALAGVIIGVETLPQAILMLVGGSLADSMNTRRIMVVGELGRFLILTGAIVGWTCGVHSAALLIGLALGFGAAAGLSNPARATLARQLVRREDLITVSGWMQVTGRLARLGGAPLGALLVAAAGLAAVMSVDALTFALSALALIVVIRPRYSLARAPRDSWHATIRQGLAFLKRDRPARTLTLGLSSLNVFLTPVEAIGVTLRVSQSGWGAAWVGFADATLAVGAIAGSVWAIRWRGEHLARRAFWTLVIQGVAVTAIAGPERVSLLAGMLAIGVSAGLASVWLSGTFQRTIRADYLGRVSSVSQLGDLVVTPFVLPIFAACAGAFGIATAVVTCASAMAGLCLFFATRTEIRTLE